MKPLHVTEIFFSIQGESLWTGLPCVFVRLSGCNLRCRYCDTRYAYAPGRTMTPQKILDTVAGYGCRRLTITGGEPLLQEATPDTITFFLDHGYDVSMETNGSLSIDRVDSRCIKVMDLKCPGSGMQDQNRLDNIELLGPDDQIKFVIADRSDYDFAVSTTGGILSTAIDPARILYSTVHGVLAPERLASWMLESNVAARLQLQLHKVLWPHKDRGV